LPAGLAAPGWANVVVLQMLMPAFSAVLLGLFFLPKSPIYHTPGPPGGNVGSITSSFCTR
jgi:hypothetical protein